jgi:hypothetical protein
MAVVRCRMTDCVNWDEGYCSATRINIDDEGVCLTYVTIDDPVEVLEQEPEWEPEAEEETDDDLLGTDDEEDDEDLVIRGRRRWAEW